MSTLPNSPFARLQKVAQEKEHERQMQRLAELPAYILGRCVVTKTETVPESGTVPTVGTVPTQGTVPFKSIKVRHCNTAQEGHSQAEECLYQALFHCQQAKKEPDGTRLVTVGWKVMAEMARMTQNNVRANCFRLIQKLAIEKVARHNSEERTGATYRVFPYPLIIQRRKAAGMEWTVRNRGGVTFVARPTETKGTVPTVGTVPTQGTVPIQGTAPTQGTGSLPIEGTGTVPTEGTLLSHIEVNRSQTSSSLVEATPDFDDDARRRLVEACRRIQHDVTLDEIAEMTHQKRAEQPARKKTIKNPTGFLLTAVPNALEGAGLQDLRAQRARHAEQLADDAQRIENQITTNIDRLEKILNDPNASNEEKAEARQHLKALQAG